MVARLRRYARVSFLHVLLYLRRRLASLCPAVPVSQTACTVLLAIVPDLSSCGWDCLCRWQGRKGSRKWHRSSLPLARPRRKPTPLTGAQRSRRNLQNFQPTSHGTSLSHTEIFTRTPRWFGGTARVCRSFSSLYIQRDLFVVKRIGGSLWVLGASRTIHLPTRLGLVRECRSLKDHGPRGTAHV